MYFYVPHVWRRRAGTVWVEGGVLEGQMKIGNFGTITEALHGKELTVWLIIIRNQ